LPGKTGHFYEFGGFRLDAENHGLWLGDRLVSIAPKALELLILLIRRHGNIVSREELLETIWRDTFVEEANINYTVSQLRKILNENSQSDAPFVQTVPKQGYRFVAEVKEVDETASQTGNPAELTETVLPPIASKSQIRWHFIAIILLGVLFLTSFAAWWSLSDRRGLSNISISDRNIRTVAILPLKTLNESEKNRALSIGLTDSLISRLGSLNRFAVRPLNSVKDYMGIEQEDPLKFGEKLRVDAVLEGTLQQTENRLRVNVRLWDVRDGALLWQDSFDSVEADFFDLQDTISNRVTQSLVSQLIDQDRRILAKRDTKNRAAFDAYWRGRFFLEKRNAEKASAEFQQAIGLDPNYALAYAGLADALIWQANFTSRADSEFYEKAKTATGKALAIDPNLAEAHSSLGRIKYSYNWDWRGAEDSFRRAIELNPNSVDAHQYYARLLTTLGRYDEALGEIYKARELDPRSADLGIPLYGILEKQGKFDEGLKVLQATLEMDKDSNFARRGTAKLYLLKGDYAKVVELGNDLFPNSKDIDFAWSSMLATAYQKIGRSDKSAEMRSRLKKMAEDDPKSLYFLALHDSELGRADEAIAALQKCLELREERMIWTKDEPRFANLKNDSRFQEILRKINLAN
jgi:DNA-binding winged helix-turn-helix (wHTH) protein/TolB-like protein/Tfp pilus assembly protein PilF